MGSSLNRRDVLKMLALLPTSLYFTRLAQAAVRPPAAADAKNVLIVLLDALTAKNIQLYGYPRKTMPNLARMAEQATVYHSHYSGGNFTTPGTSSLLTGTYPWTHRAVGLGRKLLDSMRHKTLFAYFDDYYRTAYSHNNFVNTLLRQFFDDIDLLKPQMDLFLRNYLAADQLFPNDQDIASVSWERDAKKLESGYSYSLFFSTLYQGVDERRMRELNALFPRGIPHISSDEFFLLEQGVDWVCSELPQLPQPFLGYFHFLPPHHPYTPRRDYVGAFYGDSVGYYFQKPQCVFNHNAEISMKIQENERRRYDEYLLYADGQIGRIYDYLVQNRLLDNTWVVFTSDHGEMFERGIFGHRTPVLYQSIVRIPLLIREPGQTEHRDVYTSTNAVDVLPTLLKVTGHPIPQGLEGTVLPPFADQPASADHSLFCVEAKDTPDSYHEPLHPVSTMIVKGNYKLTRYASYWELGDRDPWYELYDLENDPEEMVDLSTSQPRIAAELRNELETRQAAAERPYQNG
jgi:arylsulfatase A-like enzyme